MIAWWRARRRRQRTAGVKPYWFAFRDGAGLESGRPGMGYLDPIPPAGPGILTHEQDPSWPTRRTEVTDDERLVLSTLRDANVVNASQNETRAITSLDAVRFETACAALYERRWIRVMQMESELGNITDTMLMLTPSGYSAANEETGADTSSR